MTERRHSSNLLFPIWFEQFNLANMYERQYSIDPDAIVIAEVFSKKTRKTSPEVLDMSQKRLKTYDDVARERSRK
jgi:hypothetical protein